MMHLRVRQRGQALVEALLMLPIMAVLLFAVAGIGGLQFSAMQMGQASRATAMTAARAHDLHVLHSSDRMSLSGAKTSLTGVAAAGLATLQREWFGQDLSLVSVEASTHVFQRLDAASLRIARHTRVASGAGYAHGDSDAQHRIAHAATAWRQSAEGSLMLARELRPVMDRMEAPWRRPRLSLDWLSAWSDAVPADRLSGRGWGKK